MLWSKNYSTMEKQLTCRMPQIRYQSAGRREAMAADCVEGPRYPMNLQTTGSRWTGSRHLEQTRKCVLLKQRNTETKISRSTKCGQQGRKENYKLIWGRGEGKQNERKARLGFGQPMSDATHVGTVLVTPLLVWSPKRPTDQTIWSSLKNPIHTKPETFWEPFWSDLGTLRCPCERRKCFRNRCN